ncbi:MAG TPA: HD-GYP domain-containing protein [Patescibacteria group bacterium]|nr:HD-GYP domain-containing protein [Patescibacteria group bacterium]
MSNKLKLCIITTITLGITYFIYSINAVSILDIRSVIIFAILAIVAESLLIPTSSESAISVGFAIDLAAILVLGVPEAAWVASFGVMLRAINLNGKRFYIFNFPAYKTLFNGANILFSAGIAGLSYKLFGGTSGNIDFSNLLLPLMACIIVYVLINETIMSWLMAAVTGESFISKWLSNVFWAARDCIFVAPLGVLMAIAYMKYNILGIFLFLGPLLLARYSYKLYIDMRRVYIDTVKSLSQAIEIKDPYTQGHSMRVGEYAVDLGKRVRLSHKKLENLKMAAILHDIGKIGIEETILNKPGKLTEEEFDKIKNHPENGFKILQDIEFLKDVSQIILSHHEKMDGTGYPKGKKQGEISREAAILSIADVYDALTSDRPYRKALTVDQAISIIEEGKGQHFDAHLAEEFIHMIKEQRSEAH